VAQAGSEGSRKLPTEAFEGACTQRMRPPGARAARSSVAARSRSHGCGARFLPGAGGSRSRGAGREDFRGVEVQESIGRRLRGNSNRRERTREEEESFEAGEGVATGRLTPADVQRDREGRFGVTKGTS